MKEIRLLDDLGHGSAVLSKGDIVSVGGGKDAIDPKTADAWVRAGLALDTAPGDVKAPAAAVARSQVVVHERGGMELLQAASAFTPSGGHEGPVPENPTDSDLERDTEEGATRTAAGDVIEENAVPAPTPAKSTSKSAKKR